MSVGVQRRGTAAELELGGAHQLAAEPSTVTAVVGAARRAMARTDLADAQVHLAAEHPATDLEPLPEAVADALGLTQHRDLLQLRRPLPIAPDDPARATAPELATRPFALGEDGDGDAWIRVNNRAFAHHPDQGAEDATTLAARVAEPWFDAAGFLVADDADRPGELAGFCWTKVHPPSDEEPHALGEIYVIGVDPSHQGQRLGIALVLAGLDHLAGHGIATGSLYVEADNEPALGLYHRLGFALHRRRRVYTS